jgi:hypothetical protein
MEAVYLVFDCNKTTAPLLSCGTADDFPQSTLSVHNFRLAPTIDSATLYLASGRLPLDSTLSGATGAAKRQHLFILRGRQTTSAGLYSVWSANALISTARLYLARRRGLPLDSTLLFWLTSTDYRQAALFIWRDGRRLSAGLYSIWCNRLQQNDSTSTLSGCNRLQQNDSTLYLAGQTTSAGLYCVV